MLKKICPLKYFVVVFFFPHLTTLSRGAFHTKILWGGGGGREVSFLFQDLLQVCSLNATLSKQFHTSQNEELGDSPKVSRPWVAQGRRIFLPGG